MFSAGHNESNESVAAQWLRVSPNAAKEAAVRSSDDPTGCFRYGGDGEFLVVDADRFDLDLDIALICEPGDSVLSVLAEGAADDVQILIHAMNDQSTGGHGHRWNCIKHAIAYPAFEAQAGVLDLAE
ncbi:MAG: hypothetical protein OXT07_16275 [bacterium]|nr:hypothetical protein [bacterium]